MCPFYNSLETARVFAIKSRDTHALMFCSKVVRASTADDYSVVYRAQNSTNYLFTIN